MSLTGAVVNALAIAGGGAIGLLFRRGIPERVSKTVMVGLGLCVLYIGISVTLCEYGRHYAAQNETPRVYHSAYCSRRLHFILYDIQNTFRSHAAYH